MVNATMSGLKVETRLMRLDKLVWQLEAERASFISQYKDLANAYSPTRARFFIQNANKGDRRNRGIIDCTPQIALRTLVAGLISGMTNPSTKWFHLTVKDRDLAERWTVKDWLEKVEDRMFAFILGTNLYQCFAEMYWDAASYGTAPIFLEKDLERGLHGTVFPVGSYCIGQDAKRRVRYFSRKFRMTVRQVVDEFGRPDGPHAPIDWTNISPAVRNQWQSGWTEAWVDVCHVIYPNELYDERKALAKFKRFASCYYELGTGSGGVDNRQGIYSESSRPGTILRESGYDYFPVVVARWELSGEDIYATSCPGMTALGDSRALQQMHKRKAQAIEKKINPPMVAYAQAKTAKLSTLPGETSWLANPAMGKFEPAYQITFDVTELSGYISEHQARIKNTFYVPLFLLFAEDTREQPPTAAEIHAKQQERLLQIGPVLERFNQEVFDLLIDIVFGAMLERGDIPTPPPELEGIDLRVQYVSVLADAQKSSGLASIDRFLNTLLMILKAAGPNAVGIMDKVDLDQLIDEYAERAGVPRKIILSDERVAALRASRNDQARQAQLMQAIPPAAKAAKDLAGADMSGDNALTRLAAAKAA